MKTLQMHLDEINDLVKNNPEALGLMIVTSKDAEGNGYNPVHYSPAMGFFESNEFDSESDEKSNSICLN